MPHDELGGIMVVSGTIADFGRDLDADAISDVLSFALSPFFEGIRNKRKCNKAINAIAKSIAEDASWVGLKRRNSVLLRDGILKDYFYEADTVLLLDAILNIRPAFKDENNAHCYAQWVDICNPIEFDDGVEEVLFASFACICVHLAKINKLFSVDEFHKIYQTIKQKAAELNSSYYLGPASAGDASEQSAVARNADTRQLNTFNAPDTINLDASVAINALDALNTAFSEVNNKGAPKHESFLEYIAKLSELSELRLNLYGEQAFYSYIDIDFAIPFIGRAEELLELKRFCFSDKRLSWWSISGKSGAGKSRMASELCRQVQAERKFWYCAFMPNDFFDKLDRFHMNWALDRNLLAIVENPGFRSDKLGEWLKQLIESDTVNRKIRLLIIDRNGLRGADGAYYVVSHSVPPDAFDGANADKYEIEYNDRLAEQAPAPMPAQMHTSTPAPMPAQMHTSAPGWVINLKATVGASVLENLCYNIELKSMELDALDYSSCMKIIEEIGVNYSSIKAVAWRIIDQWKKCDPGFEHPSILLMILTTAVAESSIPTAVASAVAKTAGSSMPADCGSLIDLLEAIYILTVNRVLSMTGATRRDDPVYTAAILAIVYSIITASRAEQNEYIYKICEIVGLIENKQGINKVKTSIRKFFKNTEDAPPDLVTGYFVIKTLNTYIDKVYAKLIMQMAWRQSAFDTANFICRIADDYHIDYAYELTTITDMLDVLYEMPDIDDAGAEALYGDAMVHLSAVQDIKDSCKTAARVEKLLYRDLQNKNIAHKLVRILANISLKQDSIAEIAKMVAWIAKVRRLGFAHDKEITFRLYKTLYKLLLHQDLTKRKETVSLMDELRNEGFEYDKDIALILAQSMLILTVKQDEEGNKETIERLEALRDQGFKHDRDIALELIKALLNLTTKQDSEGRESTIVKMEALRDQGFEHDREITLELVKAMLNLTIKQDESGILKTVGRIESVRNQGYKNDKDITLLLFQAYLNLTTKQDEAGIEKTVKRLDTLRNQCFEGDRDIALVLATALFNLTTRQSEDEIKKTVTQLEKLRDNGFTKDRDITLRLVQALFSLTTRQGPAVRKEAATRIDAIRNQGFENDKDITLTLVKSLYNLSIEQNPEETKDTVMRIEEISGQGYSQDKEIKLLFAKALFNLTTKLDVGGIVETVSKIETLRSQE